MGLIREAAVSRTSPEALMKQMHLPPGMKEPFEKVILAGMKAMFSKESHATMMKYLQGPDPIAKRVGEGVAGIVLMLFQESQRSIPPQLLIPATTVLVAHAKDYLDQAGNPMTPEEYGEATDTAKDTILRTFKIDPNKVQQIAAGARK